ncbi:hypothetical protein BDZ97DRAFT_1921635 [Flammula alnicola]|nr:hypothetical protein BDZ97DRAFT_1921635 [Flammula alnicola]
MAILSPLYNLPNHVLEKQKMYQASSIQLLFSTSTKPIMMRGPRGPLYVGVYGTLFAVGMVSSLYAFGSLILGKKKE